MRWHVHRRPTADARGTLKKKEGKSVGCFLGLFFCSLFCFGGPLAQRSKGPPKIKTGDPVVGGWVGQRPKKDQGQIYCFDIYIFKWYFLTPLTEKRPKTWYKKSREKSVLDFGLIFCKTFRHDLFFKTFLVVLLNSPRWETPGTAIKQKQSRKSFYKKIDQFFLNCLITFRGVSRRRKIVD
jgi:hypothetical protein